MASTTSAIRLYRVSSPRRYSHSSLAPPLARAPLCFARPGFLLLAPPSLVHPRRRSPNSAHAPRHSVGAAAQARNNEYGTLASWAFDSLRNFWSPFDTPSLRTTVHLGQSHLHASVFAASHPLSPIARVAQLRAETRLRVTDQHHPRVALCGATQPLDTSLTAVCAAQPLPLATMVHAVTVTCQKRLVPPTPLHAVHPRRE
ncbi:hypothetical protein B0H14DRAFT_115735 [Mycena olivaceomarginata]|nr:hypothetical protein B0H14DRAFT_115735 [Mycena olivaceomarginata]